MWSILLAPQREPGQEQLKEGDNLPVVGISNSSMGWAGILPWPMLHRVANHHS